MAVRDRFSYLQDLSLPDTGLSALPPAVRERCTGIEANDAFQRILTCEEGQP